MRLAVISDIHGNLEALSAVLIDRDKSGVDETVCLGDMVGYGPDPQAVVNVLTELAMKSVLGNHEQALFTEAYLQRLNPPTRKSVAITRTLLTNETLQSFTRLPQSQTLPQGCRLVHGCPPHSVRAYLISPRPKLLEALFNAFPEQLCFIGHTHNLALYEHNGQETISAKLERGITALSSTSRYIINVGSVGQPRDAYNKDAKYVIWDTDLKNIEVRFVPYDSSVTVEKIIALGFPQTNATRLL